MFSAAPGGHTASINKPPTEADMRFDHNPGHDNWLTAQDAGNPHLRLSRGRADMKIFVVEDSAAIRERLVEMIGEIEGVVVVGEAASSDAAVAGIRRTKPDVAIFDIQLAAGSGIDALIVARREQPGLRAIVLTNYATPQHEKAAVDAGAEYFLDKSADFEKIAEVLEGMKSDNDGISR
jgi:CheY-like chemotaxis protein